MGASVVYVHGIGNKPRPDVLRDTWDRALTGGPLGDRSHLGYWAHLRYPEPLPGPLDDGLGESLAGVGGAAFEAGGLVPTEQFVETTVAELAAEDGTLPSPDLRTLVERMAYAADAAAVGSDSLPEGFEAIPGPRFLRVAAFRAIVRVALRDVHAYFFQPDEQRAIRAAVREALEAADPPVVVVAHSLGSVIAYDVLHEARFRTLPTPLLVTLGSPLGITEVQDHVRRPLEVPPQVEAWLNVADGADVVALDPTLRPEYRPADRCTDALVVNTSPNRHGIAEYLATTVVRRAVAPHLGVPV